MDYFPPRLAVENDQVGREDVLWAVLTCNHIKKLRMLVNLHVLQHERDLLNRNQHTRSAMSWTQHTTLMSSPTSQNLSATMYLTLHDLSLEAEVRVGTTCCSVSSLLRTLAMAAQASTARRRTESYRKMQKRTCKVSVVTPSTVNLGGRYSNLPTWANLSQFSKNLCSWFTVQCSTYV